MDNAITSHYIAQFPSRFHLVAHEGTFTIDQHDSYYSGPFNATLEDHLPGKVMLYVHRVQDDGTTVAFAKGTPRELMSQIVPIPPTVYDGHSRHACEEHSRCPQHRG